MVLYAAECQGNTSLTCSALLMKTAQRTSPQGKAHTSFLDESQKRTDTAQAQATPITMGAQDSLQAHSPFPSSCSGLVDIRKLFFFLEGKFIFMFKQNKVNLVWGWWSEQCRRSCVLYCEPSSSSPAVRWSLQEGQVLTYFFLTALVKLFGRCPANTSHGKV